MANKQFYSIKEFARKINYSERQVRQWCSDGDIKAWKVSDGRKWLIPKSVLKEFPKRGDIRVRTDQESQSSPPILESEDKHWGELVDAAEWPAPQKGVQY